MGIYNNIWTNILKENKVYKTITMLILLVSMSFAQEKIGVVYSERIVLEYEEFKDIEEQLRLEFGDVQKKFDGMQAELDSMLQDYDKQSLMMSADLKKAKEQEIVELQNSMQNYALTINNDITKRQQQLEYDVMQKYKQAVNSVATQKGYTLIIDGSMATQYVNPRLNITDDVLYELRQSKDNTSE